MDCHNGEEVSGGVGGAMAKGDENESAMGEHFNGGEDKACVDCGARNGAGHACARRVLREFDLNPR